MELQTAINCLKNGEIIIYPSESCYGFGCDATNPVAVAKVRASKQRDGAKPFIILVSRLEQVEQFGIINETAQTLSMAFHPGPLSLVIQSHGDQFNYLSHGSISFRIPKSPLLLDLLQQFGKPIITSSVNMAGEASIYRIAEARALFGDKVCSIIDNGDLDSTIPVSTVYDTRTNTILREGPISNTQITAALS